MSISAYLYFDGDCEAAFTLYRSVFGGDYQALRRFKDGPPEYNLAAEGAEKIMHLSLPIGNTVLMGADVAAGMDQKPISGSNFSLSFSPASREQADAVFAGLKEGGTEMMAMQDTFWVSYFGMVRDRFGIQWLINFNLEDPGRPGA
ncbi:MAG: VOC family protein [Pseudomonadota bacterium]